MKLKQMIPCAALAAAVSFGAASPSSAASPYPLVPLAISGTVYYTTNGSDTMNVPIKMLSYTSQTLINLLNVSSDASNAIFHVTGKKQIPAGSSFLWDPYEETLTITNKNGFSFPLEGSYTVSGTTKHYDYGYLEIDYEQLIGTYSLAAKTMAGSETDRTGIYFYFYDGSVAYNEIELYGTATLTWTYGAVKKGSQNATVSVTMSGCGNDDCYINDYDAIPVTFSATGSGTSSVATGWVPFFWEW